MKIIIFKLDDKLSAVTGLTGFFVLFSSDEVNNCNINVCLRGEEEGPRCDRGAAAGCPSDIFGKNDDAVK